MFGALALCLLALAPGPAAKASDDAPLSRREIAAAARRGLELIQQAAANYPAHRTCFSCHHQTLPLQAMATAREYGLEIDEGLFKATTEFSYESFQERLAGLREGKGIGGASITVGHGVGHSSWPSTRPTP
jgi:N-acyl-D-amino-acid deacylase